MIGSVVLASREKVGYRNSASAAAGKNIRLGCHIRFVAGVSMSKPREFLEETWPTTPGSRRQS
jgi:hypothetical protein